MIVIKDKERGNEVWTVRSHTLEGTNLARVRLRYAGLFNQNMQRANLSGANLWGADLRFADLRGANLSGANLRRANLGGAKLTGANLWDAVYDEHTVWPEGFNVDLEGARLAEEDQAGPARRPWQAG